MIRTGVDMRVKALGIAAAILTMFSTAAVPGIYGWRASALPAVGEAQGSMPCNRACLRNTMDEYVTALVKHDHTGLPLTKEVKFTENTARIELGDGLWVGAQGPVTFKIYGLDPQDGEAGLMCTMKEFGKPVIVSIRLRVRNRKIAEIEQIVRRDPRPEGLPNLVTPRPGLLEDVPPGERTPRAKMREIANDYFESIVKGNGDLAPFADDCVRHENGVQTTTVKVMPKTGPGGGPLNPAMAKLLALGCHDSMNTGAWVYITKIKPRRILIVDEVKGLVFAYPMFVHRGAVRVMQIHGVPGVTSIPINFGPIDMKATAIFKIRAGKIHEIEAMGFLLPYGAGGGWN
jgi:hypothetical protein